MSMIQCVTFADGPRKGHAAMLRFPGRFTVGMQVRTNVGVYVVRSGPIADAIERTQEPIDFGAVVLELASGVLE